MDPVESLLGKVDKETNQNKPQGSASLEGAEFTMKYYAVDPKTNGKEDPAGKGHQPKRTWVLEQIKMDLPHIHRYLVSGDPLYLSPTQIHLFPIGVTTIQETAPEGYLINQTYMLYQLQVKIMVVSLLIPIINQLFQKLFCHWKLSRKKKGSIDRFQSRNHAYR